MASKSKILFIGGTGYIGKFIVAASVKAGHETLALVREATLSNPDKTQIIDNFKSLGVKFLIGDLYDKESLLNAIKQVDVVISAVGHGQYQGSIIAAIKEACNIKRFIPSEYGNDVDRVHAVEPAKSAFASRAEIRREIEAAGIPYTYVSSHFFARYHLNTGSASVWAYSSPKRQGRHLRRWKPKSYITHFSFKSLHFFSLEYLDSFA
ncbi:phenylcoumaran benzylic ether reductase Pyrc5-like [Ziziphus jujuba]|uniref:Phenylcoumaran benzylic ether reductase Pyrc5-like n=1 Tax=Ziziphus jujuba TaxID=326968 RepID=A0ABM3ZSS7_ZIZJJ|nr:phenylcoumaran benzylic ether reductase Pyrc5-like [Ziziphus jujuba]